MTRFFVALSASTLLLISVGAVQAEPSTSDAQPKIQIRGPGAVFATVDAAAVDALAYAHSIGMKRGDERLMRGGTIVRVEGGFSYAVPETASRFEPRQVRIRLTANSVAHYKTYPKQKTGWRMTNRMNETHSDVDRANVDKLDPRHRPSYILTPSLAVKVYRGKAASDLELARLDRAPTAGEALVAANTAP